MLKKEVRLIEINDFVMIQEIPCKVNEIKIYKVGKRSDAVKYVIIGTKLFKSSFDQISECHAPNKSMHCFEPVYQDYELAFIDTNDLQIEVVDENGKSKKFDYENIFGINTELVVTRMLEQFQTLKSSQGIVVTILTAPISNDCKLHSTIVGWTLS
jgi:hypothetical protein